MDSHLEKLDKYAEIAVKIGLNLQAGQCLLVDAPLASAPLVRLVAKHAYLGGARFVEVYWDDDELKRVRFQYAPRDSFELVHEGLVYSANYYAERRDAYLGISGTDPDLLRDQDPTLVALQQKTLAQRVKPAIDLTMRDALNWLVLAAPIPSWAARVFPERAPEEQMAQLWDAIFAACRINESDPVAAWEQHLGELGARRDALNERRYNALHFSAPDTDLTVGLSDDHLWAGGASPTESGISFTANMPTEEVFTMPHRERVDGIVTSSLPLSVRGRVIKKFTLVFAKGRVVQSNASNDQAVLDELLATDDGAKHLGEVALVPASNPIARVGILFYNTLFDENAASHVALGKGYPTNVIGGSQMTMQELAAHGANESLTHLDLMIGSREMNVDGLHADGAREPVMRAGEWAFDVR
jgi:aminopeptidase